ncbi:hypothetical protein DICPUDRAFT_79230 [Dictyostelium purpureum]|uniref:Uncharacterized protein n=1 Tax=Dictyostelium purpureum TaxID=5786 RepID=F0ZLY5_DICPU|nr:uncharacterized protein DICPUDRAFT_79230 [Dictyostelium purpureum]EGC35049.1 hypothetical protein DICPUDRAFT_79230 [Dictyostelium purpureum]|eukprot:XP_003288417.1 hypothetical protein DICPUDRAFT_79230 [Dictyostelium purpureum]
MFSKKFEIYQILSFISLLFFIISLIFSSVSIKDNQIWLEQRLYNYTYINNEIGTNTTDLTVEYSLKYISIKSSQPIFNSTIDRNGNRYSNHEHICLYERKLIDKDCGPSEKSTIETVKSVFYLNIVFIFFSISLLVVEVNYLVIDLVSVSRNPKLIYYFLLFRFIYIVGTILELAATILFASRFPKTISFDGVNGSNIFHQENLYPRNGLLLAISNCVFTSIGSVLIIFSLYFYVKNSKGDRYRLLND